MQFSIIMPAYNAEAYINEAINSVLAQIYSDWELIVVDDGSKDSTAEIVKAFVEKDARIKLIQQENKRLGAARNTGIQNASGIWIAFLDSDDIWLENKLSRQKQIMEAHPEADVIFSDGYSLFEGVKIKLPYHFPVAKGLISGPEMYRIELKGNHLPVLSVIVKKEWVQKTGKVDEETIGAEDWDYWLRLSKMGATFFGMSDKLFVYRVHQGGMSSKLIVQQLSSFNVLYKNMDEHLIGDREVKYLRNFGLEVYNSLLDQHSQYSLNDLSDKLVHLYKKSRWNKWIKIFGPAFIFRLFNLSKSIRPNLIRNMKGIFKKVFLKIIEFVFFNSIRKFNKHKHNFTIQYYRWLLGNRLKTHGYFYMHNTSKINAEGDNAKLITYGLAIHDHSILNIGNMITGRDVVINKFCHFNIWSGQVSIGNNVLFNNYCSLNSIESIEIGDNTWFGEGVRLYDHNHKFNNPNVPFTDQGFTTGKIKIGSNVWIGSNTVILQNVEIGDNCVIGANNLIYKSVPKGSVVKASAMGIIEQKNNA